jgi:DNA-binding transcriptional regulator YiaG
MLAEFCSFAGLTPMGGSTITSGDEIQFLRHEMLMSQKVLSSLLGVSEQEIRRWEKGKIKIPKPPESLLRVVIDLIRIHPIQ